MTINPLRFGHEVNEQFLRYQLTAFPIADPTLAEQAKDLLKRPHSSPLIKGPFISLTRSYKLGKELHQLVQEGAIHPAIEGIAEYPRLLYHQQEVLEAVKQGNHCLVATGTGSGKTESFLFPIFDHCLQLRDQQAKPGIVAILVYPMNALAYDQLTRLRRLLAGTGITFGMYTGSTPSTTEDSKIIKMKQGEGRDKIRSYSDKYKEEKDVAIAPYEERVSEQEMRENPPRIILTNINQLEFLMTRGRDLGMFEDAPLRFIVFDEAHTYTGTRGAEVACLIRRIRTFCHKKANEVICIGTSATITDPSGDKQAGIKFAQRFFGVDKDKIKLVEEVYQEERWPDSHRTPPPVGEKANQLFQDTIEALENEGDPKAITEIIKTLTQETLDQTKPWKETIYDLFKRNKIAYNIYNNLNDPCTLDEATKRVWNASGRFHEIQLNDIAELLTYLILGTAVSKEDNPLFKPKIHYFIQGLGGLCVVLHDIGEETPKPELFFSAEEALRKHSDLLPSAVYPVMVCTNCGQHYYETYIANLDKNQQTLNSGNAEEDNVFWPLATETEGTRIIFTDRYYSELEIDDEETEVKPKRRTAQGEDAYICRFCGTLHKNPSHKCCNPTCRRTTKLLKVIVLPQYDKVTQCPSCGYHKTGYTAKYEPFRPLKGVNVADVHIMAQNMINADGIDNRKLIVFADNRQDAAYQAAWMTNHARRYRLRHLMYEKIQERTTPLSVGDLQEHIYSVLKKNVELARTIAPEVYMGEVEEAYSTRIDTSMKTYLRYQLIKELGTSYKQRESLETWGVTKVIYHGLDNNLPELETLSKKYNIKKEDILQGIETFLDMYRRSRHFYDEVAPIYTQYWHPGCPEIQRGFIPFMDYPPKGLKFSQEGNEKKNNTTTIYSQKGQTLAINFVTKWGIKEEDRYNILSDIWNLITSKLHILKPITLKGSRGNPLPTGAGLYQVDSTKIGLVPQYERYRCNICQRSHTRDTPNHACTAMRCQGKIRKEQPSIEDYNISLLQREFIMLVAKEHTAQVPAKDREKIEDDFKKANKAVNCLVATPTLELGVDIGDLDMILMRNVPPLPSNYWQRAGRAGRRYRMAVIYTYCTSSIHDEYFFKEPLRILKGYIAPPRFNLRNPVMIRKHIHSAVLSKLVSLARTSPPKEISESDQEELSSILSSCFPQFISNYLTTETRQYRQTPTDVSSLTTIIDKHKRILREVIYDIFSEHWPTDASAEVTQENLDHYLIQMPSELQSTIDIIHSRLLWTRQTQSTLLERKKNAPLDESDTRLLKRCDDYIKNLLKTDLSTYTLNVLQREGFLPAYGTSSGNICAFAGTGYSSTWRKLIFDLNRSQTIAVREFVPGNMIYANGGKYKTSLIHLPIGEEVINPQEYFLDIENQQIIERGRESTGYSETTPTLVEGIPIYDVELMFVSHVSDEETNRFRLPVYLAGYLRQEHRGGESYSTSTHEFDFMRGQKVRLVNVGPSDKVMKGEIGYPICLVCGAVRSPYQSETELKNFEEMHVKTCTKKPGRFAVTADAQVDGILFKNFSSLEDGINLVEGIRIGANQVLEMDTEDLQILALPLGPDQCNIFLYDQMIGGSGLLNQIIERWEEIITASKELLQVCPNACAKSCYSCMRTYRNRINHGLLDRQRAVELLIEYKHKPKLNNNIPAIAIERTTNGTSTNLGEMRLRKILSDSGFPSFEAQQEIPIPHATIKKTRPELIYVNPPKTIKIAIYLDGLSKTIHGNQERQAIDNLIRTILRSEGWHVEEIASSALDDPEMMKHHLRSLAKALENKN